VVSARSGEIVVIGGLMQESTEETTSAVPFFSEIPVLGELFKQRRFESSKSELVILLKPMVAGAEQWREDIEGSRERMRELRRIMESTESPGPAPAASRQRQR
jgi:MSHA biogenesis protein MshL